MVERVIYNSETILRSFDLAWALKDFMSALGYLENDVAGATTTVLGGFAAAPTAPASLTVNLSPGRIYQNAVTDSSAFISLPSDSTLIQQQGIAAAQAVLLSTAALSAGQSQYALIQAQFSQTDQVRTGDPTGGVEQYFDSTNPSVPFQGPNNDGLPGPTVRRGLVTISVALGTPATTGSEVPPSPSAGWVPLYLVDLAFGQTAITLGEILVAGPSVGTGVPSNYPSAPFMAGLLKQHHLGTAGQAPQIDLTAEVKNTLPLSRMPASNTVGGLSTTHVVFGNPNGNLAGNANVNGACDFAIDLTDGLLYFCSTTGTSTTAVWTAPASGSTSQFSGGTTAGSANAQTIAATTPTGFTKTAGQVVSFTVGTGLTNTASTTLNVDATGVVTIQKVSGGSNVNLAAGDLQAGQFYSAIYTGTIYLLQSQALGALATMGIGQWLKNNGSGLLTINNGGSPLLGDDGAGGFTILPQGGITPGTYTNAKVTVNQQGQVVAISSGTDPTYNFFVTPGSGTYVPASALVTRIKVRMAAGGGSGGAPGFSGNNGVDSAFASWTAKGGTGGAASGTQGLGGQGGANGTGTLIGRWRGSSGMQGTEVSLTGTGSVSIGMTPYMPGGTNPLGGAGLFPSPSSGAGGASFGTLSVALGGNATAPGSGGAGEYVEFTVLNPPYPGGIGYTVGAPGTPTTGGLTAAGGGIWIEEFYD